MSWQTEWETALTTALRGDTDLLAQLTSAGDIVQGNPQNASAYPCVVWNYSDEPDDRLNFGFSKINIALRMHICAIEANLQAIETPLVALLDMKKRRKRGLDLSPVMMTNWVCKRFIWLRGFSMPTGLFDPRANSREIWQRDTEWVATLYGGANA